MKAALYRNVFKFLVKQSAETLARSENGRLFHAQAAATANARSPSDQQKISTQFLLHTIAPSSDVAFCQSTLTFARNLTVKSREQLKTYSLDTAVVIQRVIGMIYKMTDTDDDVFVCIEDICYTLHCAMLHRVRYFHGKSSVRPSVCLSVCDIEVSWSQRLEYFESNFMAD